MISAVRPTFFLEKAKGAGVQSRGVDGTKRLGPCRNCYFYSLILASAVLGLRRWLPHGTYAELTSPQILLAFRGHLADVGGQVHECIAFGVRTAEALHQ